MNKSYRYDYERHPYYELPLKTDRKKLQRKYRHKSKQDIKKFTKSMVEGLWRVT